MGPLSILRETDRWVDTDTHEIMSVGENTMHSVVIQCSAPLSTALPKQFVPYSNQARRDGVVSYRNLTTSADQYVSIVIFKM